MPWNRYHVLQNETDPCASKPKTGFPGPIWESSCLSLVKAIQDSGAGDRVTELFWFCSYCPSRSILGVGRQGKVGMPPRQCNQCATGKTSPLIILCEDLGCRSCTPRPAQPGPCISLASRVRLGRKCIWSFICHCSKQFQ